MAGQRESDEAGRRAIAAHLREGEELLWVGRTRQRLRPKPTWWYAALAVLSGAAGVALSVVPVYLLGTPLAWPMAAPLGILVFAWCLLVRTRAAGDPRVAITSQRLVIARRARRPVVESFDLAGDEAVDVVRCGDGSGWLCVPGVQSEFWPVLDDVGGAGEAIERARKAATAAANACESWRDGGLSRGTAGPLAPLLRPGERVLWAGRPGGTFVDVAATTAFLLVAMVAFRRTEFLAEGAALDYKRWATAIGAVGLCLTATAVFLWLSRRGSWWVVSSERVLAAMGALRRRTAWASLRSVRELLLVEWSGGRRRVGFAVGLPAPDGVEVRGHGTARGSPLRLAFVGGHETARFYDALSDARRAMLQRGHRSVAGLERALWTGPGAGGRLPPWVSLVGMCAALMALEAAVEGASGVVQVGGAGVPLSLVASMSLSAVLCGVVWWWASSLRPGRRRELHLVTPRRVVSVRGLFGPLVTSRDPGSISEVRGGRFGRRRLRVAPGSGGRSLRVRGDPREAAEAIRQARDACREAHADGGPDLGLPPGKAGSAAGLLKPGERLLWGGRGCARPLSGPKWTARVGAVLGCTAGVGAVASGVLPSWALALSAAGGAVLGLGLCLGVGRLRTAGARYAVTTRRVIARAGSPLPRVRSVDLTGGRDLTLVERADGVGDVTLVDGSRDERAGALRSLARWVVGPRRLVLHGVPQAVEVFKLIQWARAGAVRERDGEEGHGEDAGER